MSPMIAMANYRDQKVKRHFCAFALVVGTFNLASAQTFEVLLSSSSAITGRPGFPSNENFAASAKALAHDGLSVHVVASNNNAWVLRNNTWLQLAQNGASGALGPNRSGSEANHVFTSLSGTRELASGGALTTLGSAGAPGSSNNPVAFWNNISGQNVEVFRLGVDNALGPNLGPQWRLGSTGSIYYNLNHVGNSITLDTVALKPDNTAASLILMHQPGVGNSTCLLAGDTGIYGPNLADPTAAFGSGGALGFGPVAFDQRVFVTMTSFGATIQEGIWRICNGAPNALALSRVTGVLGPGTSPSGTFDTIRSKPRPMGNSAFIFTASYRSTSSASLADGLFVNQNGSNQLLAAEGVTGPLGPGVGNATFESLSPINLSFAGSQAYAAFVTTMLTPARQAGLWRVRSGNAPEAVLILGQTSVDGSLINSIGHWTVFANGDVVAQVNLATGASALVRFAINKAPRVLLMPGQNVVLPTPNGPASATLSSYQFATDGLLSGGASSHWANVDGWAGSNGSVLFTANVSLNSVGVQLLVRLQASDQETLLRNGFE